MPSSRPSSCSVSCISPYANNIVVKSAICPSQSAIHFDNMCPAHHCPASSEQLSFSTKFLTPIGNVQPNFLLPQSYATPTPYAPVFAHRTVHTVGPRIVAWDMTKVAIPIQNLGTIKHHRLEGLLRFKKLIISRKLYIVC